MWQLWRTVEVLIGVWWGDRREGVYLEDLGVDGRIILKLLAIIYILFLFKWIFLSVYWILKWILNGGGGRGPGLIWLRIVTGGGHLWMRRWTFGFLKLQWISWLPEDRLLLASQEGPFSRSYFFILYRMLILNLIFKFLRRKTKAFF